MATTNYALRILTAAGDRMMAGHFNKFSRVIDRVAYFLAGRIADGVTSGALIQTTKRIAYPGTGIVDGCAWAIAAAYEEAGTAQAGSSSTQIKDTVNLIQADNYWVGAWVFAESGANNGEYRRVTSFDQTTAVLTVASAFSNAFSVGDSYRVTFIAIRPDTLTNTSVNYVFGRRVSYATQGWTTAASGIIEFYASVSSTKPSGEIYLGTITLDGSGTGTAVSNDPGSDVDRNCYKLEIRDLRGTTEVEGLAGGANTEFYITHAEAYVPGAFTALTMDDDDFTIEMLEHYEDDRFKVCVTNNDAYAGSSTLTWRRYAFVV